MSCKGHNLVQLLLLLIEKIMHGPCDFVNGHCPDYFCRKLALFVRSFHCITIIYQMLADIIGV